MKFKLKFLSVMIFMTPGYFAYAAENNFPELKSSYLKTGAFIGPDHVKRITPGLHKDQVRLEIGNPHFNEGIFGVKTWNYAFNFYTGKANEYVTCQYMVKYDADNRVTSTHWKDNTCEEYINPTPAITASVQQEVPVAETAPTPSPEPSVKMTYDKPVRFEAIGLFPFAKSGIRDLDETGSKKLDDIVNQLKQDKVDIESVVVTGHTDYIGSDQANLHLSQARADTVRSYLEMQSIDGRLIHAYGKGEANPVVECNRHQLKNKLIACLQPNRRVEIEVKGVSNRQND